MRGMRYYLKAFPSERNDLFIHIRVRSNTYTCVNIYYKVTRREKIVNIDFSPLVSYYLGITAKVGLFRPLYH